MSTSEPERRSDPRLERLTVRQRDVLELLAKGLTNEEIGNVLGIGAATVKTHVAAVLAALEVSNRTEAAGLVNAADPALAPEFATRPAIAVLAFEALGFEPDAGKTFVRGFADDLVNRLCRWRWFPVIARASSLAYDNHQARARLDARFLIHGSVRRDGERYRVTAFVDDAGADTCIWSSQVDTHGASLFEAQERLAEQVVAAVYPAMISAEVWRTRSFRAKTLDAWTLVHRAYWHVEQRSPSDNRLAHELVDRALASHECLLPAWQVKARALMNDVLNQWTEEPEQALAAASRLAEDAVRQFPEAAIGHMLRARLLMSGDPAAAAFHAEIATAINPSLAEGHALLGQMLALSGHVEDGLARMHQAHRLSPRAYVGGLAGALWAVGRYSEALQTAQALLVERPQYLFARMIAAGASAQLGEDSEARRHVAAMLHDQPAFRISQLRRTWHGRSFEAGERLVDALLAYGVPR